MNLKEAAKLNVYGVAYRRCNMFSFNAYVSITASVGATTAYVIKKDRTFVRRAFALEFLGFNDWEPSIKVLDAPEFLKKFFRWECKLRMNLHNMRLKKRGY